MTTITLFEHETKAVCLTDADRLALERLRSSLNAEVLRPVFVGGREGLRATEYVGVVRLPSVTVQVLPKVYRAPDTASEAERAREATRNLLHMMALTGRIVVKEHALAPLLRAGCDWFEVLTRLFATHMAEEWQRGAHRSYQVVEDDLPVLKGRWRLAEQLRRPERKHLFSVAFDEFTPDNPLNRVFRYVVERLWSHTRDAENRRLLGALRAWLDEVTLASHMTARDAAPSLLTRLNARYAPLLTLARLFLENASLQTAAGSTETFAFVFDMNRLFESFVTAMIRRNRGTVLPPAWRGCDVLAQTSGAARYMADAEGRPAFRLEPDIAFRDGDGAFPLLIDTKYKRLARNAANMGISSADFYQMAAYAHRYHCPRVLLLYPETESFQLKKPARYHLQDTHSPRTIEAATIDIRRDFGLKSERRAFINDLRTLLQEATTDE